ncbi:hypothetical protein Hanom_Chr04g00301571 [Helianthus anomalus]
MCILVPYRFPQFSQIPLQISHKKALFPPFLALTLYLSLIILYIYLSYIPHIYLTYLLSLPDAFLGFLSLELSLIHSVPRVIQS